MATVVLSIHLLLALGLIVVVLLQRSEGGGLGIGGGGGGGVMTGRGAATALSKVTWILGIAFVTTSLTLTIMAARDTASDSILDRFGTGAGEMPTPEGPALPPGPGDDLLPPIPQAPSAPQAEDGSPAMPPPVE